MAHVLLPSDLPNWAELQRQLGQLRLAQNVDQLISDLQKLHDVNCVNLDPDEIPLKGDETRYEDFRLYLNSVLKDPERLHFFKAVLPGLVSIAQRLRILKPVPSFQFSLQQEDGATLFERRFLASLVANAILSTFPRRTIKTHPTLQDFSFGEFFRHLQNPTQQEKLKYIFKYFEKLSVAEPKGGVRVCRQVLSPKSKLTLPGWLCNTRTLCPIAARAYGNIEDSEPQMIKTCFCSRRIGGSVMVDGDCQESQLFCRMPELLSLLCFVEALENNESLFVEGVTVVGKPGETKMSMLDGDYSEADVILLDADDFSDNPLRQYEDASLLRELTKLIAAFGQYHSRRRPSPVGESSSSSTCPERGSPATGTTGDSSRGSSRRSSGHSAEGKIGHKFGSKASSSESDPDLGKKRNAAKYATLASLAKVTEKLPSFAPTIPSPVKTGKTKVSSPTLPVVPQPTSQTKSRSNSAPAVSKYGPISTQPIIPPTSRQPAQTQQIMKAIERDTKLMTSPLSPMHPRSSIIASAKPRPPSQSNMNLKKHKMSNVKKETSHGSTGKSSKGHASTEYSKEYQPPVSLPLSMPKFPPIQQIPMFSPISPHTPPGGKVVPRRRIKSQPSGEEEYYTADESMDECEEMWFLPGLGSPTTRQEIANLNTDLPNLHLGIPLKTSSGDSKTSHHKSSSKHSSSKSRNSRSSNNASEEEFQFGRKPRCLRSSRSAGSSGFALGDHSDDDDDSSLNLSVYEKYEDFRRRFRRRSRAGLSRKSRSRHSRPSSSGSSEMDDIVEDPEFGFGGLNPHTWHMRSASSEPSLVQATPADEALVANFLSVPPDALLMARRGRKLVMTTGDGQLKAYSYDGVHPNLPVPFKAKFRRRRSAEGVDTEAVCDLQTDGKYFYSYANAAFWRKVEAEAKSGVTSPASSSQEDNGSMDDDSDQSKHDRSSHKSSDEEDNAVLEEEEEKYYNLLLPSSDGLRPVATGRWGCGRQKGDPQLKAVLQWLAASVAGLPYLIFYTKGDPYLEKIEILSKVAEAKQWTVGDLACETLRYCRNRLSLRHNNNQASKTAPFLFTFLMGNYLLQPHDSLE